MPQIPYPVIEYTITIAPMYAILDVISVGLIVDY